MKAEILAVGTELLLGDTLNTNAQYLSKELANMGINVYHHTAVGDNPGRIKEAYALAFSRADLVITTGGLGPTEDDLTKEIAGEYFNKKMILDQPSLDLIKGMFSRSGRSMPEGNIKQAVFPEGATIIPNNNGTAPGCIIEQDKKTLILLPGPPREVKPMFENTVVPFLSKYQDCILVSKIVRICGIGESHMEEKIKDIIQSQTNPTIAPYAKDGEVTLRITARAETREEGEKMIKPLLSQVQQRLGQDIYGYDNTTLEMTVAKMLIDKNLTISIAESCTGGLLAGRLVNYPGISSVFMEGIVAYSNQSKVRLLGVKEETLREHGAVSEETAKEMAEGIAKAAGTDIGLSVTGIAGPGGGTDEKPVGLVYVGLYIKGEVKVKELRWSGSRDRIRSITVTRALDWLRREI